MLLASKPPISSHHSSGSAFQELNYSYNSVNQPIWLEISLSHRRVTLYRGMTPIKSYPIAVGRAGWRTPVGHFQVVQKIHNPTWINPLTGQVIAGGSPDNPLGHYWIGFWTDGRDWIGFHGTDEPNSVGKPSSHGCIRMYNHDAKQLFQEVKLGTPVTVVR